MKNLFRPNAIHPPSKQRFLEVSKSLNLDLNEEEEKVFYESFLQNCKLTEDIYFVKEKSTPSTYARTMQDYDVEDNSLYYKCLIKGEEEGVLKGLKISVKDTVFIAGLPLMMGSHILEGFTPDEDATIIQRILKSGGTINGKTNCEDFCFSGSSITCCKGQIENPLFPGKIAGGSSSGSAVSVATGYSDLSVGGDQGGSIRIPAACCGLIGLKPTFGLIPYTGILGMECNVDHVGPIGKTVEDIAKFLQATAGPDDYDQRYYTYLKYSQFKSDFDETEKNYLKKKSDFEKTIKFGTSSIKIDYLKAVELYKEIIPNLKIGILKEGLLLLPEEEKQLYQKTFDKLKLVLKDQFGINNIEEFSFPQHTQAPLILFNLLDGYLQVRQNFTNLTTTSKNNTALARFIHTTLKTRINDFSPNIKSELILKKYLNDNYGTTFLAKATNIRSEFCANYRKLFDEFDLLLVPTLPNFPTKLISGEDGIKELLCSTATPIFNTLAYDITGNPALTINVPLVENFCPLMVIGRHFEDHRVLQFSRILELLKN